ncbi:MAG TPA: DUF4844 domain-containing protein [Rhizomicrobium sp.]|nr:DUF4844 domain-containing protein [Rhizomicrobium sp.]
MNKWWPGLAIRGAVICLLIVFSAILFWGMLMPAMSNQQLLVTPQVIEQLKALKPRLTFGPDGATFYTGIHDPVERSRAEAEFSELLDHLIAGLPQHPSTKFVERQMAGTLSKFRQADTEDRERAIKYCEEIFRTLGARHFGRFLNIMQYGQILGRLVKVHG